MRYILPTSSLLLNQLSFLLLSIMLPAVAMAKPAESQLFCNEDTKTVQWKGGREPVGLICKMKEQDDSLTRYTIQKPNVTFTNGIKSITAQKNDIIIVYVNDCGSPNDVPDDQLNQCTMSCEDTAVLHFIKLAKKALEWTMDSPDECKLQRNLKDYGLIKSASAQLAKAIGAPASGWITKSTMIIIIPKNKIDDVGKIKKNLKEIDKVSFQNLMKEAKFFS